MHYQSYIPEKDVISVFNVSLTSLQVEEECQIARRQIVQSVFHCPNKFALANVFQTRLATERFYTFVFAQWNTAIDACLKVPTISWTTTTLFNWYLWMMSIVYYLARITLWMASHTLMDYYLVLSIAVMSVILFPFYQGFALVRWLSIRFKISRVEVTTMDNRNADVRNLEALANKWRSHFSFSQWIWWIIAICVMFVCPWVSAYLMLHSFQVIAWSFWYRRMSNAADAVIYEARRLIPNPYVVHKEADMPFKRGGMLDEVSAEFKAEEHRRMLNGEKLPMEKPDSVLSPAEQEYIKNEERKRLRLLETASRGSRSFAFHPLRKALAAPSREEVQEDFRERQEQERRRATRDDDIWTQVRLICTKDGVADRQAAVDMYWSVKERLDAQHDTALAKEKEAQDKEADIVHEEEKAKGKEPTGNVQQEQVPEVVHEEEKAKEKEPAGDVQQEREPEDDPESDMAKLFAESRPTEDPQFWTPRKVIMRVIRTQHEATETSPLDSLKRHDCDWLVSSESMYAWSAGHCDFLDAAAVYGDEVKHVSKFEGRHDFDYRVYRGNWQRFFPNQHGRPRHRYIESDVTEEDQYDQRYDRSDVEFGTDKGGKYYVENQKKTYTVPVTVAVVKAPLPPMDDIARMANGELDWGLIVDEDIDDEPVEARKTRAQKKRLAKRSTATEALPKGAVVLTRPDAVGVIPRPKRPVCESRLVPYSLSGAARDVVRFAADVTVADHATVIEPVVSKPVVQKVTTPVVVNIEAMTNPATTEEKQRAGVSDGEVRQLRDEYHADLVQNIERYLNCPRSLAGRIAALMIESHGMFAKVSSDMIDRAYQVLCDHLKKQGQLESINASNLPFPLYDTGLIYDEQKQLVNAFVRIANGVLTTYHALKRYAYLGKSQLQGNFKVCKLSGDLCYIPITPTCEGPCKPVAIKKFVKADKSMIGRRISIVDPVNKKTSTGTVTGVDGSVVTYDLSTELGSCGCPIVLQANADGGGGEIIALHHANGEGVSFSDIDLQFFRAPGVAAATHNGTATVEARVAPLGRSLHITRSASPQHYNSGRGSSSSSTSSTHQ